MLDSHPAEERNNPFQPSLADAPIQLDRDLKQTLFGLLAWVTGWMVGLGGFAGLGMCTLAIFGVRFEPHFSLIGMLLLSIGMIFLAIWCHRLAKRELRSKP